ncbi:class I adenylate-forming enzyme family protein [Amycolatopsis alkalitolerans]|uniref:Long-chain fatty acid--CoA ligase n=1 Tax=Amycolatopsis alkalitolerans TaxID=2547244 RepID=A0A5C4LYI7_9PSEU|nr:AMP-binding protein [Amycolatopsis alkalitolerans]TNC23773.1 long-chain fatty acid--CoA ligase [Amycolatopsis alkalitolerans]
MDVPSLMRQAVAFNRDRVAVITEHETFTFEQMWARGVRLANALRDLGVRPGDRVAGLEDNNLGAADLFLGAAIAGAVRVPLYARNSAESHGHMIEQTGTSVVLTDQAYADSVAELPSTSDCLRHVVVRDDDYEKWLAGRSDTDPMVDVDSDAWYIIRHSAGTTGRPKGVGYTQHDWLVNCRNWFYRLPNLDWESVVGHAGPISHASGYLFLPAWLHGSTNLLFGSFDPVKVLGMLERHRVTHMFAPPSMVQMLAAEPSAAQRDLAALQCILVGGAPITDSTANAGRRVFGDVLYQVFGQTEAVPLTVMTPQEWFGEFPGSTPMRAAGRVLPFARIEARDVDGTVLPIGEEGELYAKVESQMRGFWGDDELTATRLVDGWVRTRDIGRIDENGFVYILDRADDMIVSGGFNIWPAELETVINDHPEVIEVAVFAIPHEKWGETPMAVCRVEEGATVTEEGVIDLVRTRLGSYKKPSKVELTTEPLPKNVVGKLLRKALREPHWQAHGKRVSGA